MSATAYSMPKEGCKALRMHHSFFVTYRGKHHVFQASRSINGWVAILSPTISIVLSQTGRGWIVRRRFAKYAVSNPKRTASEAIVDALEAFKPDEFGILREAKP